MTAPGRRQRLSLRHTASGRLVPLEVPTVFGRSDAYYRYKPGDERPDRLRPDVVQGLAALDYIKLCSDDQVSRTHGLLDPRLPGICDLCSTNGVRLNDRAVPTRDGEAGPLVELHHDDRLQVGRAVFEVIFTEVSPLDVRAEAERHRRAFVGGDLSRRPRAEELKQFLEQRKGFGVRDAVGWQAVIANCYRLQQASDPEGLAVCILLADTRGAELVLDGEPFPLEKLMPLLSYVPGRKVLVLETRGDPRACEELFAAQGYEDMVLISSMGPALGSLEEDAELIVPSLQSRQLQQVRESVGGASSLAGAYDDALDGLDALIAVDSNRLDFSWVEGYAGRLKVTFGERTRTDEQALSHSLRLGSSTFRF